MDRIRQMFSSQKAAEQQEYEPLNDGRLTLEEGSPFLEGEVEEEV